jgi:hypothetical protein
VIHEGVQENPDTGVGVTCYDGLGDPVRARAWGTGWTMSPKWMTRSGLWALMVWATHRALSFVSRLVFQGLLLSPDGRRWVSEITAYLKTGLI